MHIFSLDKNPEHLLSLRPASSTAVRMPVAANFMLQPWEQMNFIHKMSKTSKILEIYSVINFRHLYI